MDTVSLHGLKKEGSKGQKVARVALAHMPDHFAFLLFLLCFSRFSCIASIHEMLQNINSYCLKATTDFSLMFLLIFKYTSHPQYAWLVGRNITNLVFWKQKWNSSSSLSFPWSTNHTSRLIFLSTKKETI
jgi:hypothetical protein